MAPALARPTDMMLARAWAALGGAPADLDRVGVAGDSAGLLPSTLPALPAMVAAVSASTLAASVLDAVRRNASPAGVSVDVEHVALAARSERYAREEGSSSTRDLFGSLSRFWRTSDGWLRPHAIYSWHRERLLGVLGCDERPESVKAAMARWCGQDLEDALAAAGALGYVVRDRDDWRRHPQGRAVADLPLLEHVTGATGRDGPPAWLSRTGGLGRAADGARVLDLTRVIAGPVATRTLAAWGADVLRLDSPRLPEIGPATLDVLPGKRSAIVDFAARAGRQRLEELLTDADVLVQGYRPGALDRFGLVPAEVTARHPQLTVVVLSAWGTVGPWAGRRGFDSLVQCSTGIAALEGDENQPGALPAQILDHATGYLAAASVLLSLASVREGGPPRTSWLSLAQTADWLLSAGRTSRETTREVDAEAFRVRLPGASRRVEVIAPPGRTGELAPEWASTTAYGSDQPSFQNGD